jgi:hypothetical protein
MRKQKELSPGKHTFFPVSRVRIKADIIEQILYCQKKDLLLLQEVAQMASF